MSTKVDCGPGRTLVCRLDISIVYISSEWGTVRSSRAALSVSQYIVVVAAAAHTAPGELLGARPRRWLALRRNRNRVIMMLLRVRMPVPSDRVVVVVVEIGFGGGGVMMPYLHHCLRHQPGNRIVM